MTKLRTVGKTLTDLFLPVVCAGCARAGPVLCVRCAGAFDGPYDVARQAMAHGPPMHALAVYQDVARTVVLAFKERGRRDVAVPLGRIMGAVLPTLDDASPAADHTWWLIPAPSSPRMARSRGGSHMLALARHMAAHMANRGHRAAVAPALTLSNRTKDSANLTAAARTSNLKGKVGLMSEATPPPTTKVVLIDDVITTGATAAACTAALRAAKLEVTAILTLTTTK
jgi:predicted amidophosphoribosyltransferase